MESDEVFLPPTGPPPLLNYEQLSFLCFQGWIQLDLPQSLTSALSELDAAASAFFDREMQQKEALYTPKRGTEYGFYHVPDEKEYITFRSRVHSESAFEDLVSTVWQQAGILLHRILGDMARAGGYDPSCWDHLLDESLSLQPSAKVNLNEHLTMMRLFRYYPKGGFALHHVDLGLLTLCVGNGKGLQVLDRTQQPPQYVDVEKPTILIGDTMRVLLGNRVHAGLHQVVENPDGRHSIVFALRPFLRHPTDMARFGGEGIVDTKELYRRIRGNKYNVNARKDIRDEQLKKQEEERLRQQHLSSPGQSLLEATQNTPSSTVSSAA